MNKKHQLSISPQLSLLVSNDENIFYDFEDDTSSELIAFTETAYGIMNAQLRLPMQLSIDNLDLEIGYYYNVPNALFPEESYKNTSFIGLSIGYMFPISL